MTPKEKAEELYVGYWYLTNDSRIAKQCALIAVDEIRSLMIKFHGRHMENNLTEIKYWEEVKTEIEEL